MPAPIIMVHGAFCGGWAFEHFRQPFEARGHVCTPLDLAGHGPGQSGEVSGLSMGRFAAQVAEAVAACESPPVLIGHSMGGLVCALAASRAKISGLILLAPSAPWGVTGVSMEEAASAVSLYSLGAYWAQAIDPDYTLASDYSLSRMSETSRKAIFSRMVPESGRAMWETLNWWLDPFMTTRISPGRAPVLAIAGGQDRIHPPSTVRQTASQLGAEFHTFPQMSHWLIGEDGWETVAEACLDWLAREIRAAA